jgi:phosphoglucomutase
MTLDHDGKIRMDCSSPYAMASLVDLKDHFDIAFGNDTVTTAMGLSPGAWSDEPNHYLATAIWYCSSIAWLGRAVPLGNTGLQFHD